MLTNFLSRLLHDPVSVYLLAGDIIATVAVGLGIIWEHGPPDIRAVANKFVIGGIALETLCTALLFAYDANIIGDQNDKIIALETRLAPRKIADPAALLEKLKPFAGTPFDFWIEAEPEPIDLMAAIGNILSDAGWKREGCPQGDVVFNIAGQPSACLVAFSGVAIQFDDAHTAEWGPAVVALRDGLNANGVETSALRIIDKTVPPNAVHIKIGAK